MEDGRIYGITQRRGFLVPWPHYRTGHLKVGLYDSSGARSRTRVWVHRLVCVAWHGESTDPDAFYVLHLDGDPTNNRPSNLRWGTQSQNERMKRDPEAVLAEFYERDALADQGRVGYQLDASVGF